MKFLLRNEIFKLSHQKVTWIAPFTVVILMIVTGILMGDSDPQLLIMASYNSSEWILFALIIVGSTIFSTEFENHTILTTLYKSSNKFEVFAAKFIVISIYNVALHVFSLILTLLLQLTPLNAHISWLIINQYHQRLLVNMFVTTGIDLISSTLIISLIFLTSCLINNNSLVITINIAIVFMGQSASASLLRDNHKYLSLIRWNPLNMYNLTTQYYNYGSYHAVSHLTNAGLLLGTLAYIVIFLFLGYYIFKGKRF